MTRSEHSPSSAQPTGAPRMRIAAVFGGTALALGAALIGIPVRPEIVLLVAAALVAIELVWAVRGLRGVPREAPPHGVPGVARALSGPLVVGLVVIVASFSGALVVSQVRIVGAEARAKDILSNTIPSTTELSEARTALRQLGTLVDDLLLAPSSTSALRGEIAEARARLEARLAAYESLPSIPRELEHVAEIARELAPANALIERVLAGPGEAPAVPRALHDELHAHLARTDEAVARLALLNNTFAETSAEAVIEHRRASAVAAILLGAISVVVAAFAGVLAIGKVRARARLVEERDRLLAARATELDAFAGRVAHDLRNPLASLALRSATLQHRHQHEPQLHDELGKLVRQAERMAAIIDDLLTFASAGARPQPDAASDLHTIVDEVVADFRPAAEAVQAELRIDEFSAVQLACTPAALTCVLSNLLGNAVKYLGEGLAAGTWIAVHVIVREGTARIEVEDTGPGLPPDAEHRVFEPFQRLNTSKPGIGLGLATVKKIVEAYGGRVGVHASLGKGSTFWFELPVAPSPPPGAPPRGAGAEHRA
jgi:signal transduction histidine kinase